MARPYSLDLRERVVSQLERGLSCRQVARLNDIAPSTAVKWHGRMREAGSPASKPMGGERPYLLAGEREWLLARLRKKPGPDVARAAGRIGRARHGGSLRHALALSEARGRQLQKKTVLACEQDRPDVARRRRWWHRLQPRLAPERLVFIDETSTKTNMTRTHGWWRRGEPLKAKVPHGHWRTTTFLAALAQ